MQQTEPGPGPKAASFIVAARGDTDHLSKHPITDFRSSQMLKMVLIHLTGTVPGRKLLEQRVIPATTLARQAEKPAAFRRKQAVVILGP